MGLRNKQDYYKNILLSLPEKDLHTQQKKKKDRQEKEKEEEEQFLFSLESVRPAWVRKPKSGIY